MRTEVLLRVANLGEIRPTSLHASRHRALARGLGGPSREQRGGVRAVAGANFSIDA
jgi:hypothetical protein